MKPLVLSLAVLMVSTGCHITIAPKVQFGGSDATVTVVNRQEGIANQIKKDTPIDAKVDGRATLEASGVP